MDYDYEVDIQRSATTAPMREIDSYLDKYRAMYYNELSTQYHDVRIMRCIMILESEKEMRYRREGVQNRSGGA